MQKRSIGLLASREAREPKELIGRVYMLVSKSKSKHDGIGIEVLEEQEVNGDCAARANPIGLPPVDISKDLAGNMKTWMISGNEVWHCSFLSRGGAYFHASWCYALYVSNEQIDDPRGILVGNEPTGNLYMGRAGEHRFYAVPLKPAINTVYL